MATKKQFTNYDYMFSIPIVNHFLPFSQSNPGSKLVRSIAYYGFADIVRRPAASFITRRILLRENKF